MQAGIPSHTAYRVALRRAAHQIVDRPLIFPDALALRILGLENASPATLLQSGLHAPKRPHSIALRAFLVARSRFAEDTLHAAIATNHIRQYVLLGAGLDTFAYRKPHPNLRVFEVDHPATQQWKRQILLQQNIAIPPTAIHVPLDFLHDGLATRLAQAGFDQAQPAVFAWLGVVPYLTAAAFAQTLHFLASCATSSTLVMDYTLPRERLPPREQLAFDSLQARVTAAGEPFQLFFTPDALRTQLAASGWHVERDLDRDAINSLYFSVRADGLRCLGTAGHLLTARLAFPN